MWEPKEWKAKEKKKRGMGPVGDGGGGGVSRACARLCGGKTGPGNYHQ